MGFFNFLKRDYLDVQCPVCKVTMRVEKSKIFYGHYLDPKSIYPCYTCDVCHNTIFLSDYVLKRLK